MGHQLRASFRNCNQIFAQILLTFRYGRDDEEVMGLKLSNESVLCVEQIYPTLPGVPPPQPLTKCQVQHPNSGPLLADRN